MSAPVVTFKKAPRRPNQSRKRSASPTSDEAGPSNPSAAATSSVIRPTKKSILNPLVQGTKRRRDPNELQEDGAGLDDFDYKADEGLTAKGDAFATRSTDYDLETAEGGRPTTQKVKLNEDGEIDDGLYRGAANYHKHLTKRTDVMDKKMTHGPIRATANVRTITLMDYQPDVCKDYKETGFCGYGDSCKFLHDRGDYLAGWQMDKVDPDSGQPVVDVEDEEEEVPFACLICREPFTDPVVTKCGHYFCMNCAIKRFQKSPKCYACGAATSGIFNKAERIIAKIEARNQKKRDAKGVTNADEDDDGGIEIGGAPSDDEDEEDNGPAEESGDEKEGGEKE